MIIMGKLRGKADSMVLFLHILTSNSCSYCLCGAAVLTQKGPKAFKVLHFFQCLPIYFDVGWRYNRWCCRAQSGFSLSFVSVLYVLYLLHSWGEFLEFGFAFPIMSMASAKQKLEMVLPPMDMEVWNSCTAFSTMFSRKKLNKTKWQPWWTLIAVLKDSPKLFLIRTVLLAWVQTASMTCLRLLSRL